MRSEKDKKYPRIFKFFRRKKPVKCVYAGPELGARVYAGPEPRPSRPNEEEPVPMCVYAGPEYFEELARKRREEEEKAEKTDNGGSESDWDDNGSGAGENVDDVDESEEGPVEDNGDN